MKRTLTSFGEKRQKVEEILVRPNNRTRGNEGPKTDGQGNWECIRCQIYKPLDQFHIFAKASNGHHSHCRACASIYQREYTSTLRGFLKGLLKSARNSKRGKDLGFDLTLEQVAELWIGQEECCAYSGHKLEARPHADWSASLERLDDTIGYTLSNVVIIAQRFNTCGNNGHNRYDQTGSAKWSREKFERVPSLVGPVDQEELGRIVAKASAIKRGGARSTDQRKPNSSGEWLCKQCNVWKPLADYRPRTKNSSVPSTYCKPCFNEKQRAKGNQDLRAFFVHLLKQSRDNNKKRVAKGRSLEHTLELSDLFELLLDQGGVCKYSGIPMRFKRNTDWKCSIERIDNTVGYSKNNVVLICSEFNTCDRSVGESEGSCQWSRELFLEAWS